MYHVYRIKLLLLIHPFIFFSFFFLSNFQHWNFSSHFSQGSYVDSRQMYCVYQNQAAAAYSSLYFFIFLSLRFSNIKIFVTLFSGTVRPRRLKLGTHVDSGRMYRVTRNQAAAAYSSLYFFIILSLQLSNIKNFRHIFLRYCEVYRIETCKTGGSAIFPFLDSPFAHAPLCQRA